MDMLNLMRNFVAVVEEGSFTAAAKRLGKTKALLSTQVTQLETKLAVRLLHRSTRSLTVTEAGNAYWGEAKRILDDVENLGSQLLNQHRSLAGSIRISTPVTYGEEVLTPFISYLISEQPRLHIDMMLTDRHVDLVNEGYDLAIRVGRLKDSNLIARPLGQTRLVTCASASFIEKYGLADHPDQLCDLPCVVDSNYPHLQQWHFTQADDTVVVNVNNVVTVNNARSATALALANTGIVAVPEFIVKKQLQNGELIEVLTGFELGTLPVHVLYPSRKHLSVKVSYFIEKLLQYFEPDKSSPIK
ncbi:MULTISPECIES: LysR family transcriptional regulator [Shewanella]|uniref:LysR family transcriptional regulator n=1 Tax=Shewanella psychromarinicola TaxID=2487742 RepID=A0A3N4DCF1_9GAMM|nr:LysR family transcriptional regulator [Shewanella psychromarinicola]AZG33562.1 LysR family transcriptional regulator [Shewanella psychromarinicola]MCL1082443.1 LysR family transcriptional regulator [Shewanella psychromarinicola]RPA23643.1 LysR family transcriptional regulator [Shewanella psychromarinicola]